MKNVHIVVAVVLATLASSTAFAAPKKNAPKPPPPPQQEETEEPDTTDDGWMSNESGLALGGHTGYSIPLGNIAKDLGPPDLNKYLAGAVPFVFEIGYRFTPNLYLGGYFSFAFAPTSSELCARVGGDCSSSATQLKFGPQVRYTFSPQKRFSPWLGAGGGYEIVNLSVNQGNASESYTVKGWEFFTAEIGGDIHVARDFTIGPYGSFGVGQYFSMDKTANNGASSSADFKNTSIHEWLTLGMRLQYSF
jgi:hypothetical protein